MRHMPRFWMGRLLVSTWAACTALGVLLGQRVDGALADWLAMLVLVAVVVTYIDSIVNDWMPPRYVLCTIYIRHLVLMTMAFLMVFMAWAVFGTRGLSIHALHYFMPAAWAAGITFPDLFYRHRGQPQ